MADNRRFNNQPQEQKEFEEKMIQVSRVSKKTKGGNKMGFSVLMVVGDRKGRVGVGLGKASDVSSAMKKGVKKAKKKMITVPTRGTTIPFSITVKRGAAVVMLKPAPQGSGVIAGGPVRAVVEAAGVRDISSKILGTGNQASNVYATFDALQEIRRLVAKHDEIRDVKRGSAEKTAKAAPEKTEAKVEEKTETVNAPAAEKKVAAKKAPAKKSAVKPAAKKVTKKTTK